MNRGSITLEGMEVKKHPAPCYQGIIIILKGLLSMSANNIIHGNISEFKKALFCYKIVKKDRQ